MMIFKFLRYSLLALMFAFAAGCDSNDGPLERAGESIDNAAEEAGDAVEDAADKVEDATD